MKDPRSVVLVLLMCLVAESKSEQPGPVCNGTNKQLMNTVVVEGNSSSFSNQPDPAGVKWEYVPWNSVSSYTIADNNTVQEKFAAYYTVDATHLNISSVKTGLDESPIIAAGLYTLTYKSDGCQSMANLVAVTREPACSCCKCTLTESGDVTPTCEIRYGVNPRYANQPKIIWINNCGQTFTGTPEIGGNQDLSYKFTSSISVKISAVAMFTCVATFAPPDPSAPPNMATNAPSYNASCIAKVCEDDV